VPRDVVFLANLNDLSSLSSVTAVAGGAALPSLFSQEVIGITFSDSHAADDLSGGSRWMESAGSIG